MGTQTVYNPGLLFSRKNHSFERDLDKLILRRSNRGHAIFSYMAFTHDFASEQYIYPYAEATFWDKKLSYVVSRILTIGFSG